MSTTTKQEEMQSVEMKPEEMQSVEVKSKEMQFKPEMQPEMQPEIQLPVSDVKPKRFALKPSKRSALKSIQQKRSDSDMKPLRQKRPASETMVSELKRCKSEPPKPITLEDLPVMIQMNLEKYVKLMKYREQLMVNLREHIKDCDGKLHPTKKGIMLSMKDWQCFKKVMKYLDKLLKVLKISAADK